MWRLKFNPMGWLGHFLIQTGDPLVQGGFEAWTFGPVHPAVYQSFKTEGERPENLMLVYLRRLDTKMDGVAADMREVKERLGILESQYASLSRRVDRMGGEVEEIRRRLDIVPAH